MTVASPEEVDPVGLCMQWSNLLTLEAGAPKPLLVELPAGCEGGFSAESWQEQSSVTGTFSVI